MNDMEAVARAVASKHDAAIIMDKGLSGDSVVDMLIAEGWTFGGVEYVGGKRIRTLIPPITR